MEATTTGEVSAEAFMASKQAFTSTSAATTERSTNTPLSMQAKDTAKKRNAWDSVMPLQHSNVNDRKLMPPYGDHSDTFNYFHHVLTTLYDGSGIFPELPVWDTWWPYAEAYHNHFARFRGTPVIFMEVGVQSGGKIALLRDYFGPGFECIRIYIKRVTTVISSSQKNTHVFCLHNLFAKPLKIRCYCILGLPKPNTHIRYNPYPMTHCGSIKQPHNNQQHNVA